MLVEYLHNIHKVMDSDLNMVKTQVFVFPALRRSGQEDQKETEDGL